jgi:cytochrome c oxidase cbb3-type subunit I/II
MPAYTWLYDDKLDLSHTEGKVITLRRLGVPYPAGFETKAMADAQAQAVRIAENLKKEGFEAQSDREIIALIAYLQRLGTDIRAQPAEQQAGDAEHKTTETARK